MAVPVEHTRALTDQARDIRLAAQRLEKLARMAAAGELTDSQFTTTVRLDLQEITHTLHALHARFS